MIFSTLLERSCTAAAEKQDVKNLLESKKTSLKTWFSQKEKGTEAEGTGQHIYITITSACRVRTTLKSMLQISL